MQCVMFCLCYQVIWWQIGTKWVFIFWVAAAPGGVESFGCRGHVRVGNSFVVGTKVVVVTKVTKVVVLTKSPRWCLPRSSRMLYQLWRGQQISGVTEIRWWRTSNHYLHRLKLIPYSFISMDNMRIIVLITMMIMITMFITMMITIICEQS